MLEQGRIGNWQLFLIVLFIILPTAILSVPGVTTAAAKQDGWLAVILATLLACSLTTIVVMYYKFFSEKTLVEVGELAFGKWLGRLVGAMYIWFLFHTNSIIIREFGEFLTTAVMPETPLSVFNITIMLLAGWAVYQGLEVIGRMTEFVFPLAIGATAVVLMLVIVEADFSNVSPIAYGNIHGIIAGSLVPLSWMGEVVMVAFITPFVFQAPKSGAWIMVAVAVVGIFLTTITAEAILVFGAAETARMLFPTFSLARVINIGDFIERVESLVMAIWVAGVFLKITIWYYLLVLVSAQTFGLRSYKPLIIPWGFTQVVFSFWLFDNFMEFIQFIDTTWPVYSIGIFEFGMPVIILMVAIIRKKGRGRVAISKKP